MISLSAYHYKLFLPILLASLYIKPSKSYASMICVYTQPSQFHASLAYMYIQLRLYHTSIISLCTYSPESHTSISQPARAQNFTGNTPPSKCRFYKRFGRFFIMLKQQETYENGYLREVFPYQKKKNIFSCPCNKAFILWNI